MINHLNFISAICFFLTLACQSSNSNQQSSNDSLVNDTSQNINKSIANADNITNVGADEKTFGELVIKGKDIWVRDFAETGKVVMKLNEGDKCRILEKGKLTVIKGRPDYWYQIEFNQIKGWVFGSQTSKMLFKPVEQPFNGNLSVCEEPLINEIGTPVSFSYSFKSDKSFRFSVAAGYTIEGRYQWINNTIELDDMDLIMDTPEGSTKTAIRGNITYAVFVNAKLICLALIDNRLVDKTYLPAGGCYCLDI